MFSIVSVFGLSCFASGQAQAQSLDLIVKSVEVKTTKANGDDWDGDGSAPDLKVEIRIKSASHTTSVRKNTFSAEFNEKTLRVSPGDTIEVRVIDQDLAFDDPVGSYSKEVTELTLAAGVAIWSFGQVEGLALVFEP